MAVFSTTDRLVLTLYSLISNGDFRLLVKLAGVLTYMPPEKVFRFWKDGVQSLVKENMSGEAASGSIEKEWDEHKDAVKKFLLYMRNTWVGKTSPLVDPMFEPRMWSAWRSIKDPSIPSTTGGSEAYNIQLRRFVVKRFYKISDIIFYRVVNHGGVWKVVDAIRTEDTLTVKKVADLAAGIPLGSEATFKRRNNAKLKMYENVRIIMEEGDGDLLNILKAVVAVTEKSDSY